MKKINFLFLIALLGSCGNPHLKKIEDIGYTPIPVFAEPKALDNGGLATDDGLSLKTSEPKISGTVSVQNLDTEKGWKVSYSFEKGEHFRIIGGDCSEELAAAANCKVEVEFFSDDPGIFLDNLKIVYQRVDDPKDVKVIIYPLSGERTAKEIAKDLKESKVILQSVSQADRLDFGRGKIKEKSQGKVVVKNIGDTDVALDFKFSAQSRFDFNGSKFPGSDGSCTSVLKSKEECLIDVSFNSDKAGVYQDSLVLNYEDLASHKPKTISFPIMGEKINSADDCQGTPCGQPYTQGPLIASEVFAGKIEFGHVSLGTTAKQQIEIQNLGKTTYKLKDFVISNPEVFAFSGGKYPGLTGTCGDLLLPGSCLIEFSYTPVAARHDEGLFTLSTVEGDQVKLTLTGDGDAIKKCEIFNEYLVTPEKNYPASSVVFPYHTSKAGTVAKLSLLYGQQVNSYVKGLKKYTVKDGMVYVTFKLPKIEGDIVKMKFGVDVSKVILDAHKDTEMLCLSTQGVRKCSGHEFSLASWQKLKNGSFWDQFSHPMNEDYEANFSSNEKKCGPHICMDLKTHYELSEIFELTKEELDKIHKEGIITLIFTDDTRMLKMPRIMVKTKTIKDCK